MPGLLALVLTLAFASLPAEAAQGEECILDLEAIRGQLDHATPGVTTVAPPRRVERQLSEAVRLDDGTVIEFSTGGCVHYGFSFAYPGVKLEDRSFASAAARAKALLERTPVRDDAKANLVLLIGALGSPHDTPAAPGETYLGCGDAVCALLVALDEGDETVTLTVSYDFPL